MRKILFSFILIAAGLFNLSAQNVPNQKRAVPTAKLEVMTFDETDTYEKVKAQLDKWELNYEDADLFYKTEVIFKNSYYKGMALSKVVISFDLRSKYITKVQLVVLENSKTALDAYIAELSKKYPFEKAYDQWTAKNGCIKQKENTLTFYFDKRPKEKKKTEEKK